MRPDQAEARWQRLMELLAPFHDSALTTARRLSRDSMEGDDLFQEAVVRAFERLHSLRDETRFRAWFYAVLLSLHRSRSRWGFWRRFLPLDTGLATGVEPAGEDGRHREEQSMKAERASRALTQLPAVQREAVVLHDIDGYKMEEIAVMQGVSVSAVKSRVARGRKRLRAHYESLGIRVAPGPEEQNEDARFAISSREQTAS